ncbi:MAG: STAS domain-containing protein [Acidimicrobiia bacterium]
MTLTFMPSSRRWWAEPPLTVELIEDGEQLRVNLRGELDIATAPQLDAVTERLGSRGPSLVVDLSALLFLDVGGARALTELAAKVQAAGRPAILTGASRRAAFLLRHVAADPEAAAAGAPGDRARRA